MVLVRRDKLKSTRELISDELRSIRAKNKMSLETVAEIAGISKDTLCRYENNQVSMQIDILEKILAVYNEDFDIFFKKIYANKQNFQEIKEE